MLYMTFQYDSSIDGTFIGLISQILPPKINEEFQTFAK